MTTQDFNQDFDDVMNKTVKLWKIADECGQKIGKLKHLSKDLDKNVDEIYSIFGDLYEIFESLKIE